MADRFLSRLDAARLLSISPATLAQWQYRAAKSGRPADAPPSVKVGKLRRYSEAALLAWVAARAKQAARTTGRRRGGAAR
jgi:hypothetical protein